MAGKDLKQKKSESLEKIVVSIGVGKLRNQTQFEEKILPEIMKELALITGQKPAVRQAKKSIAGFKTREGDIVGLQITLRGRRMNDFLNRLVHVVFPRVKDFKGINLKNIDGIGNLNVGFREQFVFPEVSAETSKVNFGLQATFVPNIKKRSQAIELYRRLGLPLKKSSLTLQR